MEYVGGLVIIFVLAGVGAGYFAFQSLESGDPRSTLWSYFTVLAVLAGILTVGSIPGMPFADDTWEGWWTGPLITIVFATISLTIRRGGQPFSSSEAFDQFGAALDRVQDRLQGIGEWNAVPEVICPYCQRKGGVSWRPRTDDAGISGTKATAAFWTGGLTIFSHGLTNTVQNREASCGTCNMVWKM